MLTKSLEIVVITIMCDVFLCHASSRFSCICSTSLWAMKGIFRPPVNLICNMCVSWRFHSFG